MSVGNSENTPEFQKQQSMYTMALALTSWEQWVQNYYYYYYYY